MLLHWLHYLFIVHSDVTIKLCLLHDCAVTVYENNWGYLYYLLMSVMSNQTSVRVLDHVLHPYMSSSQDLLEVWHLLFELFCCQNSVLEGRCPAEFCSNPNQTHLKQLIKLLLGNRHTRNFHAGVLRQVGAKLCRTPALQDQVWTSLVYVIKKGSGLCLQS